MKNMKEKNLAVAMATLWLGLFSPATIGTSYAQAAAQTGAMPGGAGSAVPQPKAQRNPAPPQARHPGVATRSAAQNQPHRTGGPNCKGETNSPGRLLVPLGKSTLMRLPEPIASRTVGNPNIVQAMLVSPETLYLLGVNIGTTNMIIQGKSGACTVIDVAVDMDASDLENTVRMLMPEEKDLKVTPAAGTLVLSGTVADAAAVSRAVEIANAFVRRPAAAVQAEPGAGPAGAMQAMDIASNGNAKSETRVINLLNVRAPQQVMLEVKVAEVSKTLLDKLGVSSALRHTSGSWTYSLLNNFIVGTASAFDATKSNGNRLTLEAEKRDGLVRILAEPTIMAISGQEGRFLAGGTIFIPVRQEFGSIDLKEKDFGVKLTFTPTVLSEGRINLKVHPEVSELSREGIGITAVGATDRAILPLLTKRDAATTVQLKDGQSFAIGGLIKNNSVANIKALPVLGEVPVLGALFRSTDFQEDRTELLFVVTPRLVKPLPANFSLPTDNLTLPERGELFLGGRLEAGSSASQTPGASAAPAPEGKPKDEAEGFELK